MAVYLNGVNIIDLPLAIALGGGEFVPVECPNGDGTYTTRRVTVSTLGAYLTTLMQFGLTRAQAVKRMVIEFQGIGGASLSQFVSLYISPVTTPDATYIAWNHDNYAPPGGTLYNLVARYLIDLGLSRATTYAHLANIWPISPYYSPVSTVEQIKVLGALSALPTDLPSAPGLWWLNGGIPSQS